MKDKTVWYLLFGLCLFISMLLFLEFNFVENIDIYGKNIQSLFNFSSFKIFFLFITNIMSIIGITIILLLTYYFLRKKKSQKMMILYMLTIVFCFIITNLIKIIIKRKRPVEQLLEVSGFSFPSSHASISMVVYGFIILLIRKNYNGKYKGIYISLFIILIMLTGLSRIYFNVHYITDVLAGYALGLIILCISNLVFKKLTK